MTSDGIRIAPPESFRRYPIIAVLRADDASKYDGVIDVIVENGVRSIELTLTTPGTLEHLATVIERVGADVEIGVGTVLTTEQASRAIDSGVGYLVTPVVVDDVISTATRAGVRVYPGALTPTELWRAWSMGASAVKLFPAQMVGPDYMAHVSAPFPDLCWIPSGGIAVEAIADWLDAGATAVSLGGPLVGDAFRDGSMSELARRTVRAVGLATEQILRRGGGR